MPRTKRKNLLPPITTDINREKFGRRISSLMAEKGYTNEMFAERIGISVTMVESIKSGYRLPSLNCYIRILEALETSDIALLGDNMSSQTVVNKDNIEAAIYPLLRNLSPSNLNKTIDILKSVIAAINNQ